MKVVKNIPADIDYEEFKWIRRGDRIKIAKAAGVCYATVRNALNKRTFNIDVLIEAQKMVNDKKKKLMELQLEGKQLSSPSMKLAS